jgi:hypothetical protein
MNKNIEYQTYGNPDALKKILFVGGWCMPYHFWDKQRDVFLEKYSSEFQICFFNNKHIGESTNEHFFYHIRSYSKDIYDLLSELQWKSVKLVGISMGGMIILDFLTRHPELVEQYVLINTHMGDWTIPKLRTIFHLLNYNFSISPYYHSCVSNGCCEINEYRSGLCQKYHSFVDSKQIRYSFFTIMSQLFTILTHNVKNKKIDHQNGICVSGSFDSLVPSSCSVKISKKLKIPCLILPASHMDILMCEEINKVIFETDQYIQKDITHFDPKITSLYKSQVDYFMILFIFYVILSVILAIIVTDTF